jgi:hypothetical protein
VILGAIRPAATSVTNTVNVNPTLLALLMLQSLLSVSTRPISAAKLTGKKFALDFL